MVTHWSGNHQNPQILPKSLFWFPWKTGHMRIPIKFNILKGELVSYILHKTALKYLNSNQNDSSSSEKLLKQSFMYPEFPFVFYMILLIIHVLCIKAVGPCHIQEVISQHIFGICTNKMFSIQKLMTCSKIIIFVK